METPRTEEYISSSEPENQTSHSPILFIVIALMLSFQLAVLCNLTWLYLLWISHSSSLPITHTASKRSIELSDEIRLEEQTIGWAIPTNHGAWGDCSIHPYLYSLKTFSQPFLLLRIRIPCSSEGNVCSISSSAIWCQVVIEEGKNCVSGHPKRQHISLFSTLKYCSCLVKIDKDLCVSHPKEPL